MRHFFKFKFCLLLGRHSSMYFCVHHHTCMSIGVKGVRGVPGKLLPPIEEGVLGMDPDRLRGGLKFDMGVGGAKPFDELTSPPPGGRTAGLLLPRWGEPFPKSPTAPLAALDPCTEEVEAAGAPGAGEPAAASSSAEVDRAGDEEGG